MKRERLIEVPGWVRPIGHVGGITARGRHIFLAGQVGWDEQGNFVSDALVDQVGQALDNILALLSHSDAGPEHITRMTWFVTDKREYQRQLPAIAMTYCKKIGRQFPPMTAVGVASLMHDEALVEIEVTAVVDDGS
ncbi:RidA family protein [Variovorax paradoxus]|uniref:RidA family protein n=1 Tax=Variovorax paradoxus TaxID=34073 RepID=UPI002781D2E4|nr:RidA family protein [Variovorax paradoxus]MDP9932769.1 enamine deaminase RidA (YjgF/YER057c/UK114 family) [Variovorax paradoxus]